MNTIEELEEELTSLTLELTNKEKEIEELESDLKIKDRECWDLERERDDLQEKLDNIDVNKEEAIELLKKLWLHQKKQTPYDVEIRSLLHQSGNLERYVTPYFLKPL